MRFTVDHCTSPQLPVLRLPPRMAIAVLCVALLGGACGETSGPPGVAAVEISSPTDTMMVLGLTVRLTAIARDADGNVVTGVSPEWHSDNEAIVMVSSTGLAAALSVGRATVAASVEGASGSVPLRVVDLDLDRLAATLDEPFVDTLVMRLTGARLTDVAAALDACRQGASDGNVLAARSAIAAARSSLSSATHADDRAMGAVLLLFVDYIESLLAL